MAEPESPNELRARYRPANINVLFVGEAPPASGTFFYAENSQVYRYLKEALAHHLDQPDDFLSAFAARGYLLDDRVLEPVDHIPMNQRKRVFLKNVPLLARRMNEYRPQIIITILKRIEPYVESARLQAGLDVLHRSVPFPGTGQQANFRREMADIVKHLP
jgi:hypothetical protein